MKCQCFGDDQGGTLHSRLFGFHYFRGIGILRALVCVVIGLSSIPCILQSTVPNLFGSRDRFLEDNFSIDLGWGGALFQDDSSTLHLSCTLFLLFSVSSTSDDQALDPRDWGPLLQHFLSFHRRMLKGSQILLSFLLSHSGLFHPDWQLRSHSVFSAFQSTESHFLQGLKKNCVK